MYGTRKLGAIQMVTVTESAQKQTGALIFLHGTGDNGENIKASLRELIRPDSIPHVKLIFPTAPLLPYSPFGGEMVNTWYDVSDFSMEAVEDEKQIEGVMTDLKTIVEVEVANGTSENRIVIGGFSRGGAMAFHSGFRTNTGLAGVAVLSSFLPHSSLVYKDLLKSRPDSLPKLFQAHGEDDGLIPAALGKKTFATFLGFKVDGKFKLYPNMNHEIILEEVKDFIEFIQKMIP